LQLGLHFFDFLLEVGYLSLKSFSFELE